MIQHIFVALLFVVSRSQFGWDTMWNGNILNRCSTRWYREYEHVVIPGSTSRLRTRDVQPSRQQTMHVATISITFCYGQRQP